MVLKGDECLIEVAARMVSTVKHSLDLVAQYGGEEFVVILSKTDPHAAIILAEEIRKSIEVLDL